LKKIELIFLHLLTLIISSCSKFQDISLVPLDINASKPSIINIVFRAEDEDKQPVPNIDSSKFLIYEDGKKLDGKSIFKELKKEREKPFVNRTVIAIDIGQNISKRKKRVIIDVLQKLITKNIIRINKNNRVMVVTFNENIYLIEDFTSSKEQILSSLDKINKSKEGLATNLYGTVARLSSIFKNRDSRFEHNSIVIITESGDNASTISLNETIRLTNNIDLYIVGIGEKINGNALDKLARGNLILVDNYAEFGDKVSEIFHQINNYIDSVYYLQYVSPKRRAVDGNSKHTLLVKLVGGGKDSYLKAEFDSSQFEAIKPYIEIEASGSTKAGNKLLLKAKSVWVYRKPQFSWRVLDSNLASLTINEKNTSQAILHFRKNSLGKTELIIRDEVNGIETSYPLLIGIYRDTLFDFEDGVLPEDFQNIGVGWKIYRSKNNISLKSGKIGNNSETSIVWKGYFEGNRISFDYRVSSEEGCDEMLFFLDGKGFYQSGDTGWRRVEYPITNGEHTFKWTYKKDRSISKYEDSAWIDNIRIYYKDGR